MFASAELGPGQNSGARHSIWLTHMGGWTQVLQSSSDVFQDALPGNLMVSTEAGTQSDTLIWDVGIANGGLTNCPWMPSLSCIS